MSNTDKYAGAKTLDLTVKSKGDGALFKYDAPDGKQLTANDPVMSGEVTFEWSVADRELSVVMPISGFKKTAETTGVSYLSLSMGVENGVHYYGRLFNKMNDEKRTPQSPDYSGFVYVLPVHTDAAGVKTQYSNEQWEEAKRLNIWGRAERASGSGLPYIKISVRPQRDTTPITPGELPI